MSAHFSLFPKSNIAISKLCPCDLWIVISHDNMSGNYLCTNVKASCFQSTFLLVFPHFVRTLQEKAQYEYFWLNIIIVPPQPLVHHHFWVLQNMCTRNIKLFPWYDCPIQLQFTNLMLTKHLHQWTNTTQLSSYSPQYA